MKVKQRSVKKALAFVLAGAMLLGTLTACGNGTAGDSGTSSKGTSGSSGSGETLKLSFSHHDSATSTWGVFFETWAKNVSDASDGACEITVYPGATLAAPADGLQALRTGVCDILWTNMAFFPGQFPVTEGTILPMVGNNATAEEFTNVLWDLWEDEEVGQPLRDEWSEFKVLILHASPGFPIGLTKAASTPADMSGRTVRAPAGGLTSLMTAINANPVLTPSGDIYTSMDKGIIEGYLIDFCGIDGFKLEEVTNYILDLNAINIYMMVIMTQEKYDSLPDSVKNAMEEYSGRDSSVAFAATTDAAADAMRADFEDSGRLIVPTEAEYALWEEAAKPVQEEWISSNAANFDSQKFYDRMIELVDQYTN
jgi:TRAP-type C4-dicarboxylate transport system substrate-binding protein